MKTSELRKKTVDQLKEELNASLKELFNLRMQKGVGQQPPKPHLIQRAKKSIACVKTILKEKGLNV